MKLIEKTLLVSIALTIWVLALISSPIVTILLTIIVMFTFPGVWVVEKIKGKKK